LEQLGDCPEHMRTIKPKGVLPHLDDVLNLRLSRLRTKADSDARGGHAVVKDPEGVTSDPTSCEEFPCVDWPPLLERVALDSGCDARPHDAEEFVDVSAASDAFQVCSDPSFERDRLPEAEQRPAIH